MLTKLSCVLDSICSSQRSSVKNCGRLRSFEPRKDLSQKWGLILLLLRRNQHQLLQAFEKMSSAASVWLASDYEVLIEGVWSWRYIFYLSCLWKILSLGGTIMLERAWITLCAFAFWKESARSSALCRSFLAIRPKSIIMSEWTWSPLITTTFHIVTAWWFARVFERLQYLWSVSFFVMPKGTIVSSIAVSFGIKATGGHGSCSMTARFENKA